MNYAAAACLPPKFISRIASNLVHPSSKWLPWPILPKRVRLKIYRQLPWMFVFIVQNAGFGQTHSGANINSGSGSYYYNNAPSGPSPAEIQRQQQAAKEAEARSAQARAVARAKEAEKVRIKAAQDELWRQRSKELMGSFGKDLTASNPAKGGALITKEAPWDFNTNPNSVSPQQAGLPPQPDGATFTTDDGEIRQVGATGGTQAYVDNYKLTRELAGNPLPADFFDRDPAVVSRDSLGNPIDRDGFVVEYESEEKREAAIIESRLAAVEYALENKRFEASLDNFRNSEVSVGNSEPTPRTWQEALEASAEAFKLWQKNDAADRKQRWESINQALSETAVIMNQIKSRSK